MGRGGGAPGPGSNTPPFDPRVILKLGRRYVMTSISLVALYIVGTLLCQTVIPIEVALNYKTLTNFFQGHGDSNNAADSNAGPKAAANAGADAAQAQGAGNQAPASPKTAGLVHAYFYWLAFTLALLAFTFGNTYVAALVDQRIARQIRRDVFRTLLQQSPRFYFENPAGRLMVLLSQYTISVALSLRQLLVDPILQLIGIFAVGSTLYMQLAPMTQGHDNKILFFFGAIALFALLSPWLVSRMGGSLQRNAQILQDKTLALGILAEGVLNAPEEIQAMCAEDAFDAKHQKLLNAAVDASLAQTVTVGKLNLVNQMPGDLVLISLIGLAVYLAFAPQSALNPGTLIAMALLTPQFMGAVQGIGAVSINASTMWPGIVAVNAVFESKEGIVSNPGSKDFDLIEPAFGARDVSFSYKPGVTRNVLDHVSFNVPPGKITGFVARPGQGKTTFFRLALRFYEPQDGEVFLGGHPIRDFTLEGLRRHVVLMSQFPAFFLDTVRENFLLARAGATDEEIEALCRKTGFWDILEENIGASPLDRTFVPGPGKSLSGGQTKLFALTRCLLRDPSILLLDEPTTGMGPKEKFPLNETMRKACAGKTVMVVDHDIIWQASFCDYFFVLNEGRIAEQGTCAELLATPGLFKELHDAYTGERKA